MNRTLMTLIQQMNADNSSAASSLISAYHSNQRHLRPIPYVRIL